MANNKTSGAQLGRNTTKNKVSSANHIVFVICILIATFFWLLIKLSDQYNESFQFKVNYFNTPQEKMLTSITDTTLSISVKAQGFEMSNFILFNKLNKLDIDLNKCEIIPLGKDNYYISTAELKEIISQNIQIPADQIEISTQKLEFKMDNLYEKTIPVANQLKLNFVTQYKLYSDITISPKEITIYGPKYILDTLNIIYTENKTINGIMGFINEDVKLINPNSNLLHISQNKVNVKAFVEKFTESSIEIPIDLSNIPYKIKTFPNTVKIFYTVAQKDFSNVKSTQFKVKVNLKNIDILTANKLQLELVEQPNYVSLSRLQPSEVEFLIIK